MSLLAILISLALEKLLPHISQLRSLNGFEHYQRWIRAKLVKHTGQKTGRGILCLLTTVLLPVFGIALIQYFLNDLLALFGFLFSVIVLTYCLGPKDEHRRVNEYLDAVESEDDDDTAQNALTEILQASGLSHKEVDEDDAARINQLVKSVLIITHDRMLAILFWFVILGPMGAVLYRLTLALLQTEVRADDSDNENELDFNNAVQRLHHLLSWIPSHLAALSYAVMGSFVHALRAWQERPDKYTEENSESSSDENNDVSDDAQTSITATNHKLLLHVGMAALQFNTTPPQDNNAVRETLGLCGRSLVAWITILAAMTLAGWAS